MRQRLGTLCTCDVDGVCVVGYIVDMACMVNRDDLRVYVSHNIVDLHRV